MEIDIRQGADTSITSIRFHDVASIVEANETTLSVVNNTGGVLVSIPKASVDAFIAALQASKRVWS